MTQTDGLAKALGWFSVGLGTAELIFPDGLARFIGAPVDERTRMTMRAMGAREIGHGVTILLGARRAGLWSRVGGDALDLAFVGAAMASEDADRSRLAAASAALAGVALLDVVGARRLGQRNGGHARKSDEVHVEYVATINRPIGEVYRFWCDFERFPTFMRHLESVQVLGEGRSRWRAKAPAGTTVQWEAQEIGRRENEWIAWRSIPGSGIHNYGSVQFDHAPGARGTEVRVQLQYRPPAGGVGRTLARLFGEEPQGQIREDVRRFKQLMETGEIAVSDGPGLSRPARPASHADKRAGVHA